MPPLVYKSFIPSKSLVFLVLSITSRGISVNVNTELNIAFKVDMSICSRILLEKLQKQLSQIKLQMIMQLQVLL